jgi:hypothetical protein
MTTNHNLMPEPITDPFKYVVPEPEMRPHFEVVAHAITLCYDAIREHCPQSAERTLAIRHLQMARMMANAAISFQGRPIQT